MDPAPSSAAPAPLGALRDVNDTDLVKLISSGGDEARAAAAEFLLRHQALIRRRLRHKLSASARRLFDSEDLFSTVARRIDQEVERQRYPMLDERQLWGLINRIGDNCIIDLARDDKTSRIAQEGPLRSLFARRMQLADQESRADKGELLARAKRAVGVGRDRQILFLWLLGCPFAAIAEALGLSEPSARKRWHRIRRELRERLDHPG